MATQTRNQIQVDYVLAEAIRASRSILDLEDDWDEGGSPGYRETTWNRASEFIEDVATAFHQRSGFYGCGGSKDTIKGKLDTSLTNEWILMWLTR